MHPDQRARTGFGIAELVLGAWLFMSPFVLGIEGSGQWHLYFWGAALVVMGAYQASRAARGADPVAGVSVAVLLVGLWVALSPLAYTYGMAAVWSNVITGLLLAGTGVFMVAASNRRVVARRT